MDANEEKLFIAILMGAVLLALLLMFSLYIMIRHQKRSELRYKEKLEAGILTLENERKRIASDLHDDIGPILSSIKLLIGCLIHINEHDKLVVSDLHQLIDDVIDKVRTTSNNLLPTILERKNLFSAIARLAAVLNSSGTLRIQTDFFYENELISKEKEIHIFRIVQEVIHNAIKHSKATELLIRMEENEKELIITTTDNGIGFNYNDMQLEDLGVGIPNIISRVELLRGDFFVDTQPGKGVRYEFVIPIKETC